MNYSKEYISRLGTETGFISSNIEKVLRLLDVLNYVFNELDSEHQKLVLKVGTAINLLMTSLSRLSVDIDLDYIGFLEKEKVEIDREEILNRIDSFMIKEGYSISLKSRESKILTSRTYSYTNAFGNKDNIKVEINFIDRIHIFSDISKTVTYFNREIELHIPKEEELFAMKICALIDRHKPRDLFDVYMLIDCLYFLNKVNLKRLIIFYLSLDNKFVINDKLYNSLNIISQSSIMKELQPVLVRGHNFDFVTAKDKVISFLKELLILDDKEKNYLKEFSKGYYYPNLLFNGKEVDRAYKHPMAIWRVRKLLKD